MANLTDDVRSSPYGSGFVILAGRGGGGRQGRPEGRGEGLGWKEKGGLDDYSEKVEREKEGKKWM